MASTIQSANNQDFNTSFQSEDPVTSSSLAQTIPTQTPLSAQEPSSGLDSSDLTSNINSDSTSTSSNPPIDSNHSSSFSTPPPPQSSQQFTSSSASSPASTHNPLPSPTTPRDLPSLHGQFKEKDKKWKQMFKFGSIGKKHSSNSGSGSGPSTPNENSSSNSYINALPDSTTTNNSNLPSAAPTLALQSMGSGSMGFQPMVGSTVVEDPNSLSNDSHSSSQEGSNLSTTSSTENQNRSSHLNQKASPSSARAALKPAHEVLNSPNLTVPDGNESASSNGVGNGGSGQRSGSGSSGSGFAARLLRRVSSAPDTNKLFSDGTESSGGSTAGMGSNGRNKVGPPSPSTTTRNGFLSPSENNPSGHSQHVSEGSPSSQAAALQRLEQDGFFPNSPVRMDSTALSFSSKDFEKGRSPNKSGSNTPKSKSGILFPGSGGRSKSGGSKSNLNGEKKLPSTLQPPSSAAGLAAIQNGANPNGANGRSNFRRTYSSNSIKIRDVEVGPNSFSKVKMLGKGDVGKVYLVREKKTEKLFAMKGEFQLQIRR